MLLLAQGVGGFLLGQIGREVALIGGHGLERDFPDPGADVVEEIAVVADHQNGTGVALEVVFQPLHGGEVQMVGGLVQNEDVRLLEEELGQTETGQLTAGEDPHVLAPGILCKAHAGQHLLDVDVHVVAVGGVDDVLQFVVRFEKDGVVGRGRHLLFQDLHPGHGVQHRGEGGAHLPVNIQRDIELCVLLQIAQRHAVGHAELAVIVGVDAGQDLEQGRLARAVLAHDADAVFFFHAGAHVVQDDFLAKALSEFFQMNQHIVLPCSFPVGWIETFPPLQLMTAVLEAEVRQLFRLHHQRVELFQRGDLVGGAHLARVLGVAGVEPAGVEARVHAALNVAGEAVAHHQDVLPVLHAQSAEGGVEDTAAGLLAVQLLGDEDVLKVGPDAGFCHPAALHLLEAVGHDGQRRHLGKLPEDVRHIGGHQVGVGGQVVVVAAVHLHAVTGCVDGLEEAGEALPHQLVAAYLALFQLTPELRVDVPVGLHRPGVRLDAVFHQRLSQRLVLSGVKVQKRIVCIEEDAIIFCHLSFPSLSCFEPPAALSGRGWGAV